MPQYKLLGYVALERKSFEELQENKWFIRSHYRNKKKNFQQLSRSTWEQPVVYQ